MNTYLNKIRTVALSKDLLFSVTVVAVWRVVLEAYAIFALHRFPFTDTISHKFYFLTIWYNYDGHHYVSIAQKGYEFIQYAFFPLYPLAIKLVSLPATLLVGDKLSIYIVAGLIINTLSLIGALYFMLQIARQLFDVDAGRRAAFLLLFFPSAIFLGAVYTESFFLFWVTGSFYFALKRNWLWASIFGAAAAGTRLVGIGMLLCLAIEFWLAYKNEWRTRWREALYLLLVPASFVAYLFYQWAMVGNPVHFLEAQKAWGRAVDVSVFESLGKDFKRGFDFFNFNETMIAPMYDGLAVVLGVVVAGVLAWKQMWSFALFTLMVTLISLASGTTVGAVRYVIVAFPAFLLLGHWGRRQMVFGFLLAFFTIFFSLLSIHYLNTWWLA
jgi:hypothetical protein